MKKEAETNPNAACDPPERLFEEYYDKIYIYIARRVNNTHDAEDLTADIFLNAFTHPYDPRVAQFSTYIFSIAANTLKNHYRAAKKKRSGVVLGEPDDDYSDGTDLLAELISREEYGELRTKLAKLPERQYRVIYLRYYLNRSFKQIGEMMSVTENNARQLHFEAISKLKKFYNLPNEITPRVYTYTEGGGKHDK